MSQPPTSNARLRTTAGAISHAPSVKAASTLSKIAFIPFPDKAPQGWKPHGRAAAAANANMKKTRIKELIEAVRGKRQKTD